MWIDAQEFALVAQCSESAARAAIRRGADGKKYKGVVLVVTEKEGGRLLCRVDSLPAPLMDRWALINGSQGVAAPSPPSPKGRELVVAGHAAATALAPPPAAMQPPVPDHRLPAPLTPDQLRLATWRLGVIRPILDATPKRRASAMLAVTRQRHIDPAGRERKLSESTLQRWIKAHRLAGLEGLVRKGRGDRGNSRVVITRKWDGYMIDRRKKGVMIGVRRALVDYVRSLWASGVSGARDCCTLATSRLAELTAGHTKEEVSSLLHLCEVPRSIVDAERRYGLISIHDKDAKLFFDKYLPRIQRHRKGLLPMDIVVGDVSPLDVYLRRDGENSSDMMTLKSIAWMDLATNRLFVTLFAPPKGRSVSRLEVAASFAQMCGAWGVPRRLYLDNGSEYKWEEMLQGFVEMSRLTGGAMACSMLADAGEDHPIIETLAAAAGQQGREIIRALPYNAPAKPIEGLFSCLNVVVGMLPGYVGHDRLNKKIELLGKDPLGYRGSLQEFLVDFEVVLRHYHNKSQGGYLAGKSPAAAYQVYIDRGWQGIGVHPVALLLSFAKTFTPTVKRGRISIGTIPYVHDSLLPLSGQKLTARVSPHDRRFAFVFDAAGKFLCAAYPDRDFGFLEGEGAAEQGRRQSLVRRYVADLRQDCAMLSLVAEMKRHQEHLPDMPETPIGEVIELSDEAQVMAKALEGQAIDVFQSSEPAVLSQWDSDQDDPYLSAVGGDWD